MVAVADVEAIRLDAHSDVSSESGVKKGETAQLPLIRITTRRTTRNHVASPGRRRRLHADRRWLIVAKSFVYFSPRRVTCRRSAKLLIRWSAISTHCSPKSLAITSNWSV